MSLFLCNLPGYGLTREITSRTETLSDEVEQLLTEFTHDDVIHTLFKTGKFRVAAHADALPASLKRWAYVSAVRFAAFWDAKTDTVWIDASLRHNPGFMADVIATAAFAHRSPGDELLERHLDRELSRLYEQVDDFKADPGQNSDILDILLGLKLLRGARTAESPFWQNRLTWSVAVVMLEKLKNGSTKGLQKRDAGRWHTSPNRRTLKKIGVGLTVPPELALLRLKDWAEGKFTARADKTAGIVNPYARRGVPLAAVAARASHAFPVLTDWFGAKPIPAGELPSALTPFTGPEEAVSQIDAADGMPFQPAHPHPLGSFDVRPAAILRTTASADWKSDAEGKLQAVLLKNTLESWGETESAEGPVYPFVATEHEIPVTVTGVEVADNLAEAYLTVTLGSAAGKTDQPYTVYDAGWSQHAVLLRAEVALTCHMVFWAVPSATEQSLPTYEFTGTVKSVKALGMLAGDRYSVVTVTWKKKALKGVPLVVPTAEAENLQSGETIRRMGLLVAGAFFHHTPVTRFEDRVRFLPPTRRELTSEPSDETLPQLRRRWSQTPTYENKLAYAATLRPNTEYNQRRRRRWLVKLDTPASIFLASQQILTDPASIQGAMTAALFTAGQFLAAGYPPAADWLLAKKQFSIAQRLQGLLAESLLQLKFVHTPEAQILAFRGEQLLHWPHPHPHDETEGLHWLMAAAARGSVPAQMRAAECYARGVGTPASLGHALALLTLLLKSTGNPQIFYLLGGLQLVGETFYDADPYERRRVIAERAVNPGRTGDWMLLILHLIYEDYPESEGCAPKAAAVALAQWVMERTGVSTAAPLLKLAREELQNAQEEGAALTKDFTPWQWLGIKEPTEPVTFVSLINPLSDVLMRSLQSEAFFDDLTNHLGEAHEETFLQFVEKHIVRMSPGLAQETENPSLDGIELGAYVGIADTGVFAGTTPALGCVRAADPKKAGKSFYFPFFPEGLAVTFRPEEAYATHENAAGFLRLEVEDENGFPVKSLVAFDPLWALLWRTYEPHQTYRGLLAGVAEKVFTPPAEMNAGRFYDVFEDTVTEAPAVGEMSGLYAVGGRLESLETDYTEIAGLTVTRLMLTLKIGGREWRHFPVFVSKARLERSFPKGLPEVGSLIFTEVNLHCLSLEREDLSSYAGYTLQ